MEKFGLLALGGGGSGGGLPPVTSSDNGDVLGVVNGVWGKMSLTKETLVCTFTKSGNTISCDKTKAEIVAAYEAKQAVIGYADFAWANASRVSGKAVMLLTEVWLQNGNPSTFTFACLYYLAGDSLTPDVSGNFVLVGQTVLTTLVWSANYIPIPKAPLMVEYTISGLPVDGVYPLTPGVSYSTILAAFHAERNVAGVSTVNTTALSLPLTAVDETVGYIMYSATVYFDNAWCVVEIVHNENETAVAELHPINTTQMSYNTSTDELSITNVPEVSS